MKAKRTRVLLISHENLPVSWHIMYCSFKKAELILWAVADVSLTWTFCTESVVFLLSEASRWSSTHKVILKHSSLYTLCLVFENIRSVPFIERKMLQTRYFSFLWLWWKHFDAQMSWMKWKRSERWWCQTKEARTPPPTLKICTTFKYTYLQDSALTRAHSQNRRRWNRKQNGRSASFIRWYFLKQFTNSTAADSSKANSNNTLFFPFSLLLNLARITGTHEEVRSYRQASVSQRNTVFTCSKNELRLWKRKGWSGYRVVQDSENWRSQTVLQIIVHSIVLEWKRHDLLWACWGRWEPGLPGLWHAAHWASFMTQKYSQRKQILVPFRPSIFLHFCFLLSSISSMSAIIAKFVCFACFINVIFSLF